MEEHVVLIADDHPIVRNGIKNLLKESYPAYTIFETDNHAETIQLALQQKPQLVLLDVSMPNGMAIDTIVSIKSSLPQTRILVISMYNDSHFMLRMVKAGADGFISKDAAPSELKNAIAKLISGKKYITDELLNLLADLTQGKNVNNSIIDILSNRELEVFKMIAKGKTVSEIAQELNLSVKTVSTYRSKIIEKTGLKNNSQIIYFAVQNKII